MYKTNRDLRPIFDSFPRSEDGKEIRLPDEVTSTIQPVISLSQSTNEFVIERIQAIAAAPAISSGLITVPLTERWVVWRVIAGHSDLVDRIIFGRMSAQGIMLPIANSLSLPVNAQWVSRGPFFANPGVSFDARLGVPLGAGSVSCDLAFTRFPAEEVLPAIRGTF